MSYYSTPTFPASSSSSSSSSLHPTLIGWDEACAPQTSFHNNGLATQYTRLPRRFYDVSRHTVPSDTPLHGCGFGLWSRTHKELKVENLHSLPISTQEAFSQYYEEWMELGHPKEDFPLELDPLTAEQVKGVENCLGNVFPLFKHKTVCDAKQPDGSRKAHDLPHAQFLPYIWLQGQEKALELTWEHILGIQLFASRERNSSFSFALTPSGTIVGILSRETMESMVRNEKGLRDLENKKKTYKGFLSLQQPGPYLLVEGNVQEDGTMTQEKPHFDKVAMFFESLTLKHDLADDIFPWFFYPQLFSEDDDGNSLGDAVLGVSAAVIPATATEGSTSASTEVPSTTQTPTQIQAPTIVSMKKGKRKAETPTETIEDDVQSAGQASSSGSAAPNAKPPTHKAPQSRKKQKRRKGGQAFVELLWQPVNEDLKNMRSL